jgi:hypothetical protein
MAKKKRKSLLQSQREKLARQRAARRAAQRANQQIAQSTRRSLPAKGRTTATSPRARVQRGLTRDRLAKQQLQNFGRALQRTMKQRQAQNKLDQAAKGTRSGQTRTAGGAGQLARSGGGSSSPTSQRIQPVRVRVEGQRQLPGAKKPAGQLPAATPKLKPASGGPKGSLPGGSGARNLLKAGSKGLLNRLGAAALVADGVTTAKDLGDSLRRGEGYAAIPGLVKRLSENNQNKGASGTGASGGRATVKPKKEETKPKRGEPIRNRRGRVVGYKPVKPARRGMSNIPPKEGTGKGSPNDKKTTKPTSGGSGTKTTKPQVKPGSGGAKDVPSNSKKNPYRMPQGSERKDRMSRVVRELQEMQRRSKKRQGKKMSKAVSKGYPGNRNY